MISVISLITLSMGWSSYFVISRMLIRPTEEDNNEFLDVLIQDVEGQTIFKGFKTIKLKEE